MRFRNPLRQGPAVLLCTTLAACFGGAVGCDVYDDELLRQRWVDDDGGRKDTRTTTDAPKETALADTARQDGETGALDAPPPDAPSVRDVTISEMSVPDTAADLGTPGVDVVPTPDDAGLDASPDGTPRDAIAIGDALDAVADASVGSRDADAATPGSDGRIDATRDAPLGTDSVATDGSGGGIDADGGSPPPTFRVVRVGDGTVQLTSASAPVFIEERRLDGSMAGFTLALPTSNAGGQEPLTLAGNATSEGALSLSLDGRYLTLAGYATSPGRAAVATSSDVDRVAAAVDARGVIDTSTRLGNTFLGTNVRSAASVDGTSFWIAGESGGVWYFPRAGAGAQVVASPDNVRLVALFADRLYGSSGASPMNSVFTVGSGRPTSGTQSATALTGMARSGLSPYAFALFDRTNVDGLDTLYFADDRSPETNGNGGGIQKWTFDGNAWAQVATFAMVGPGQASFRGLAGIVTANGATLVASTSDATANRLVVFVDDGSPVVTGTVIATAGSNTIFRGVALSPHF
jgi:hypothetical protein